MANFIQPFEGLVTVKSNPNPCPAGQFYASLYAGGSWIQRDGSTADAALAKIKAEAKSRDIVITKILFGSK